VRISIISIALAILVNSLTLAIVAGFQQEIKDKIIGFNAPFFISKAGSAHIFEAEPIDRRIPFLSEINAIQGIKGLHAVAFKPAMLQSQVFYDTIKVLQTKDSVVQRQDIFGVMFKGVDQNYSFDFLQKNLVSGRLLKHSKQDEIVISKAIAQKLNYQLNDIVSVYYVKNQPILKKMKVVGIYETGFADYDQKLVYASLSAVQQMNDFGTSISLRPLIEQKQLTIAVEVQGSSENLMFDWGVGAEVYTAYRVPVFKDTTYQVKALKLINSNNTPGLIDQARLTIRVPRPITYTDLVLDETGEPTLLIDGTTHQAIQTKYGPVHFYFQDGAGTKAQYISGYEVNIAEFSALEQVQKDLKEILEMRPVNGYLLQVNSIRDVEADLFAWLSFLDVNVLIIVVLMLLIGVINVGSALLVLIVLRTQFIGLLKALGANNRSIRIIFLYQASYLILRGMIIGNVLSASLIWIQYQFKIFTLNPEVYYIDAVPVAFSWLHFAGINILTFIVCMVALLLPSRVVARISPIKALRFQ
jgi:lipoprotein-releasing system permease protein